LQKCLQRDYPNPVRGEPHAGREAAAPSNIKRIQIVQGGKEVPPNGGTVLSQDVLVEPFSSKI